MQYYNIHHIDFKINSEIHFPGLSRITKISDCKFFFDTNHGTGSLEGTFTECTFGPFNKNSRALKKFEKVSCKQLLLNLLTKF